MDELSTIQDYSMIDEFISNSLQSFNKKLFGNYDENTGYFEELSNDEETQNIEDAPEEEFDQQSQEVNDEDMYDQVFDDEFVNRKYDDPGQQYDDMFQPAEETGQVSFKPGVSSEGLSYRANGIVNELSGVAGNFVITSGKRSKSANANLRGSAKNSFHLTGDAVDIRPNANIDAFLSSPDGRKFLADKGYEIIDERNKKGAAHWHLEPVKRQAGGSVPVASTEREKYVGLNDPALNELFIPLQGTNPIRGLDSREPVYVEDELGNSNVLIGPEDVVYMTGGVHEKRFSKKYKTR